MSTKKLASNSVQETMLIPLYGRAIAGQQFPDILRDPVAETIVQQVDYDFSGIGSMYGTEYAAISCLARAVHMDDKARAYLAKHPDGTIVYLGAGLDATFERVDNGRVHWYNLDLPDAMAYRERFIQPSERCRHIARSMFDYAWFDEIEPPPDGTILVLAAGLFFYFSKSQLAELTDNLCRRFRHGELFFEAASRRGTQIANAMVRRSGNTGAPMSFWVDSAVELATWSPKITRVECRPYFGRLTRERRLRPFTRIVMSGGDILSMVKLVSIRW